MATIKVEVVKKPIEKRIIDAGCIYWDVNEDFFKGVEASRSNLSYRRSILMTLIKDNTDYSMNDIAALFDLRSHSAVSEQVDKVRTRVKISRQITDDSKNIMEIANNLEALKEITCNIQLNNILH